MVEHGVSIVNFKCSMADNAHRNWNAFGKLYEDNDPWAYLYFLLVHHLSNGDLEVHETIFAIWSQENL